VVILLNEMAKEFHSLNVDKGFWDDSRDPLKVLMLIVTELSEAAEEFRHDQPANHTYYLGPEPKGVPIEMADAIIRILDACAAWGIDLDEAVMIKYHYNKTRPFMHGKKS